MSALDSIRAGNPLPGAKVPMSDFTTTRDEKGEWKGSESFICRVEDILTLIPPQYDPCTFPGFEFLLCDSVKIDNWEGNLMMVTINYAGNQVGGTTDYENAPPERLQYELSISLAEENLWEHPNYTYGKVPQAEMEIIIDVHDSLLKRKTPGEYIFIDANSTQFTITTDPGKELVDFITRGIDTYLKAEQVWRVHFVDNNLPTNNILNNVGKIKQAKGAPTISDNRNWLFNGVQCQQAGKIFNTTYEWILSDRGGWIPEIYQDQTPT